MRDLISYLRYMVLWPFQLKPSFQVTFYAVLILVEVEGQWKEKRPLVSAERFETMRDNCHLLCLRYPYNLGLVLGSHYEHASFSSTHTIFGFSSTARIEGRLSGQLLATLCSRVKVASDRATWIVFTVTHQVPNV